MRITYRHIPPMTVLYARSVGPYEASSREAWRVMGCWLEQHQLRRRVKQVYGIMRDNPKLTAAELVRYDACVPVALGFDIDLDGAIGRQTLPGGAFAVHTHVGSYAETGEIFGSRAASNTFAECQGDMRNQLLLRPPQCLQG